MRCQLCAPGPNKYMPCIACTPCMSCIPCISCMQDWSPKLDSGLRHMRLRRRPQLQLVTPAARARRRRWRRRWRQSCMLGHTNTVVQNNKTAAAAAAAALRQKSADDVQLQAKLCRVSSLPGQPVGAPRPPRRTRHHMTASVSLTMTPVIMQKGLLSRCPSPG